MDQKIEINITQPPTLGQDNEFISTNMLGYCPEHYEHLVRNQILSKKLEIPVKEIEINRARRFSEQTIHKYDPDFKNRIKDEFMDENDEA